MEPVHQVEGRAVFRVGSALPVASQNHEWHQHVRRDRFDRLDPGLGATLHRQPGVRRARTATSGTQIAGSRLARRRSASFRASIGSVLQRACQMSFT